MLFERGFVQVIEDCVDQICLFWKSSQLLLQLMASGFKIPPITCRQTISALKRGSPESVSFFIQHAPDDAHPNEMLQAAATNWRCGAQATRILLSLRSIDTISEAAVISILQCDPSVDVLMVFEDRWGTMGFSMDAVITALSNSSSLSLDVVEFVLSRCERFSVTENHIIAAMKHGESSSKIDLLLDYDPDFHVQDRLVAKTVALAHKESKAILKIYLQHGFPLVLTENVVRAAAHNLDSGIEALEIIFQHDSSAKVSNTVALEALRSPQGAVLITLMLEQDPSISVEEDFLIAAASNPKAGALIFEALHENGRIDFGNSTIEAAHAPPAKRRRIASNLSPLVRHKTIKSAPITKEVIEAAIQNRSKRQRSKLQSLFHSWGVLSDEDLELFHSTND